MCTNVWQMACSLQLCIMAGSAAGDDIKICFNGQFVTAICNAIDFSLMSLPM